MLSRRIVAARPLTRALAPAIARRPHTFQQVRTALTEAERLDLVDPNMVSRLQWMELCMENGN